MNGVPLTSSNILKGRALLREFGCAIGAYAVSRGS
jgi:hypothetical protein